jgi:hypothetical protein
MLNRTDPGPTKFTLSLSKGEFCYNTILCTLLKNQMNYCNVLMKTVLRPRHDRVLR